MRLQICQLALFVLFSSCYSTPDDITACVGSDVNIPWEYPDSAGMNSVSWEHIDSSNAKTTILLHFAGSGPTVENGYNIRHNTNGNVTITAATVANSGTYRITVVYSSPTPTYTDDVVVNVYDPPTDLNFTESPSGSQTTFTCTAGSLGDPAADLYIQVNGVDMITSVSATVSETDTVKCFLSGLSVQCMSTVTSICAQCPTTEAPTTAPTTTTVPPTEIYDCPGLGNSTAVDSEAECVCAWFGICCAILAGFFCNGICFGCILIRAKCCCDCFKKGKGCEDCVNNYYCRCECCASTPCGACCNIIRLPSWYQVLWASIIGIPIALGILLVWKCCGETNRPKGHAQPGTEEPLHERSNFN